MQAMFLKIADIDAIYNLSAKELFNTALNQYLYCDGKKRCHKSYKSPIYNHSESSTLFTLTATEGIMSG